MLHSKTLLIKTKSKKILKVVREHYLRDDVDNGLENGKLLAHPPLRNQLLPGEHYLLPDTNVILQQMDVIDHYSVNNVIILQTVLREVRHRSAPVYKKLRSLIELPEKHFFVFMNEHCKDTWHPRDKGEISNDLNDRLIRSATLYYNKLVADKNQKCILLTNDKDNKDKANSNGLTAFTAEEYFSQVIGHPELSDKLAKSYELIEVDKRCCFSEHLKLSQLTIGIKSGKFVQGKLNINSSNYLEGRINHEEHGEILIQGRQHLNRAVHNDIVAIEMLKEEDWCLPSDMVLDVTMQPSAELSDKQSNKRKRGVPTGKVVGIIKRNWRPYCGALLDSSKLDSTRHLFNPYEKRIPRIQIETKQAKKLVGQQLMVTIDSWPRHSKYPHGHFVRALGQIGDKDTEREVILLEHDIAHEPFSQAVLNCLPPTDWSIPPVEFKRRVDLRHLPVCSVDPPGCTDIDDCLHCCERDDGFLDVGVHIADVTYFIRPGTAIDKEASQRGTTVYLCDKRIDMVPELLSSNLCSLRDDGDRLAFSCLWVMNDKAEIISTKFTKSVIRSKKSMTYAEAQMCINDSAKQDAVTKGLRGLNRLAKILKARRIEAGALTLASPEVRFHVDSETHDPIDLQTKEIRETNSMVEEFMLLANCSVAAHIQKEFSECAVLRRHPEPPNSNFDVLINSAKARNLELSCKTSRHLAVSLDALEVNNETPHIATLLRILATRCMLQAVYFCSGLESDFRHYGLAAPIYTHFTSPIRRYSDVMVHRLLAASIDADTTFAELLNKQEISQVCKNLNLRHRMAQYAQRASVALQTQLFFRGKVKHEEAFVIFAKKNAVQVLIMKYGLEGTVFLDRNSSGERLQDDEIDYNEEACTVAVRGVTLRVFDKVIVRISHDASNIQHQRINMHLVSPKIKGISLDEEPL